MKLIAITPLAIYEVDIEKNKWKIIHTGEKQFFGFTWNNDNIYYSRTNLDSANVHTEQDYQKSGVGDVINVGLNNRNEIISGLSQTHQIYIDNNHRLFITNTGFNHIIVANIETNTTKKNIIRGKFTRG